MAVFDAQQDGVGGGGGEGGRVAYVDWGDGGGDAERDAAGAVADYGTVL